MKCAKMNHFEASYDEESINSFKAEYVALNYFRKFGSETYHKTAENVLI